MDTQKFTDALALSHSLKALIKKDTGTTLSAALIKGVTQALRELINQEPDLVFQLAAEHGISLERPSQQRALFLKMINQAAV